MRGLSLAAFIVMLVVALAGAPSAVAQTTGGAVYESAAERRAKLQKRFRLRMVAGPRAPTRPCGWRR